MKRRVFICVLLLLAGLQIAGSVFAHEHDPPRINPADVMQILAKGEPIIFLDTRTEAAVAAMKLTIPDSIRVSGTSDLKQLLQGVAKDRLIVTFCT